MEKKSCARSLILNYEVKALKIIIFMLCIVCVGVTVSGCGVFKKKSAELTIKNLTQEEIHKIRIEYVSSEKEVDIGTLKPDKDYKHSIEDQTDDSIKLFYSDPTGNEHEETVVGYVYKGMKSVEVGIKKTSDGIWVVESKEY